MKKRFQKWAIITAISVLTPLVANVTAQAYGWLVEVAPWVRAWIDPYALANMTMGLVAGGGAWLLAKWLGIPIEEIQQWLIEKGLFAGRPTGIVGERTMAGLEEAVNNPDVTVPVKRATLVPGKVSASGKF